MKENNIRSSKAERMPQILTSKSIAPIIKITICLNNIAQLGSREWILKYAHPQHGLQVILR